MEQLTRTGMLRNGHAVGEPYPLDLVIFFAD